MRRKSTSQSIWGYALSSLFPAFHVISAGISTPPSYAVFASAGRDGINLGEGAALFVMRRAEPGDASGGGAPFPVRLAGTEDLQILAI